MTPTTHKIIWLKDTKVNFNKHNTFQKALFENGHTAIFLMDYVVSQLPTWLSDIIQPSNIM
jgi:hypothetical protein